MLLLKIGGGKAINWDFIAEDLVEVLKTDQVIIVHGANATRDEIAKKLGYETKKITSPSGIVSTYTDKTAIDIFLMSYAGLVNKKLVATLQKYGVNAVGLCGVDGRLWEAKQKKDLYIKDGEKTKLLSGSFTGRVEKVNHHLVGGILSLGFTPVICPPAISYENEIVNTDNDWAAAMMVEALGIKKMVSLFEAPGMLKDPADESSIMHQLSQEELTGLLQFAKGTMKKKVLGAQKAFEGGLETMYWADGRVKNPVTNALNGKGTVIT